MGCGWCPTAGGCRRRFSDTLRGRGGFCYSALPLFWPSWGRPTRPPDQDNVPPGENAIQSRCRKMEADFRCTNFYVASDPPPPVWYLPATKQSPGCGKVGTTVKPTQMNLGMLNGPPPNLGFGGLHAEMVGAGIFACFWPFFLRFVQLDSNCTDPTAAPTRVSACTRSHHHPRPCPSA